MKNCIIIIGFLFYEHYNIEVVFIGLNLILSIITIYSLEICQINLLYFLFYFMQVQTNGSESK